MKHGATRVTLHSHQILPLPRKKLKHHLHCAEQQYSPCNVTKNCACHQKWLASLILIAYETLCTPRGATEAPLQHHQILCPPRKMTLQNLAEIYWEKLKRHLQCAADPRPFRPWSENHPTIIREWTQPAAQPRLLFALPASFRSGVHSKFHQALRLPGKLAVDIHQIMHLPPKVTLMMDLRHKRNVMCHARSNRSHPLKSPNIAPATKNYSHDRSSSHMKRHLQRAEHQKSPSKSHQILCVPRKMTLMIDPRHIWNIISMRRATWLTLQRHQILRQRPKKKDGPKSSKIWRKDWNVIYIARPIRDCSNHDPRMIRP